MGLQLPLGMSLPDIATFDSFVLSQHGLVVNTVKMAAENRGECQLYLWGEEGVGKTHLLQAACHHGAALGKAVTYLPMKQLIEQPADLLDGLAELSLICIDDVQTISGHRQWESAVFRLINDMRAQQHSLIVAANNNVPELGLKLPDLMSRFLWGPVFQIKSLADEEKIKVLQGRATAQGLELPDDVAVFMLRHFPRHINILCEKLNQLDKASLAAQRRLTIPFVKSVLM